MSALCQWRINMNEKLHERLGGIPLADHSAWGIGMGKLALVENLWINQMGWAVCHRITGEPWGNAIFVHGREAEEVWFQFSERIDVTQPQPGDHPAVCVRHPEEWANAVCEWLTEQGESAIVIASGENRLVSSPSVPITIEFVVPE